MAYTKYNLINLGYNSWSDFWKRNQTMIFLLTQKDLIDKTLFVNPIVWLGNLFHCFTKEFAQPHINKWKFILPRKVSSNITSYTPIKLPFYYKMKVVSQLTSYIENRIVKRFTRKPFMLIVNSPGEHEKNFLDVHLPQAALTIFDWSDDFKEFASNESENRKIEKICEHYCRCVDIVITINDSLSKRARQLNKNTFTVRNATNYFTFGSETSKQLMPAKLRRLDRPVIGYTGWLNSQRLDEELLIYVIKNRPKYHFVFMGPQNEPYPLGRIIPNLPNVHIWKPVKYSLFPAFINGFDVCILPNKISTYTDGNDPIKIYDYLASGNPIVSTKTSGTERFQKYIMCANDKSEFLNFLDLAVSGAHDLGRKVRMEIGERESWQKRIVSIYSLIVTKLIDS